MKRYLVTGAQGFVGRNLLAQIFAQEPDAAVVGLGRSPQAGIASLGADATAPTATARGRNYRYRQLSLLDTAGLSQTLRELRPHCVFHLASALHTAPERELFANNLEGTSSLASAMGESAPEALLLLGSSGSVYGEPLALPIAESHPCNPAELYGLSKLAAEQVARIKAARAGFSCISARIFNVVGPGQSEDHVCGRLAVQLANLARAGGGTLSVGPLAPTRDFIDVRDVARALYLLAQRGERGGIYNVGSGREVSIEKVLQTLLGLARLEVQLQRREGHAAGVQRHVADVTRLAQLGFAPFLSLEQSLADLYRGCLQRS